MRVCQKYVTHLHGSRMPQLDVTMHMGSTIKNISVLLLCETTRYRHTLGAVEECAIRP